MEGKKMAKSISFWKFLKEKKVEIPIIQRDYAQGRKGKEYLRKSFLENLFKALEGEEELKLDFVYGSEVEEKGRLLPLDGQQRLTTLWLMHWYIAYKAGKIEEAKEVLRRFGYETRVSSREFCKKLCRFDKEQPEGVKIVDHIKNQTWFYSAWKQDPTVSAMLTMLGGTTREDEKGVDILDGIEELFKDVNDKAKYEEYWEKLTADVCPIEFYYLSLDEFDLTDDLYIKMNGRGKQLTHFENFKADLIDYIHEQKWEDLLDLDNGIPIKLDTTWTDIFWKNRSEDKKIDEIYFAFLNRFFFNYKVKEIELEKKKDIEIRGENYYSYLTNKENKDTGDSQIEYTSIDNYKWYGNIEKGLFEDLQTVLDNYSEYKGDILVPGWIKDFSFIPKYTDKETKISLLNLGGRVVFYAICRYFKEGKGDQESLDNWLRFVWNVVSSVVEIRFDGVKTAINRIDKVVDSHNVYSELIRIQNDVLQDEVLKEECIKAKKIIEGGKEWEDKIKEAERYGFFHGTIRFLFQDENGEEDWSYFDKKFENVKKYFKEEDAGVRELCLRAENDTTLLKALISRFTEGDAEKLLRKKNKILNNRVETWRQYLWGKIYAPIHQILCGETNIVEYQKRETFEGQVIYHLSNTRLLDYLFERGYKDPWIHEFWGGNNIMMIHELYSWQSSEFYVLLNAKRDEFFMDERVKEGIFEDMYKIEGTDLRFGQAVVKFEYNGRKYEWRGDDKIYLDGQQENGVVTLNVSIDDILNEIQKL